MPPVEHVVEVGVVVRAVDELSRAPMEVWDDLVLALFHALVDAVRLVGARKSAVDPVLVRPPHVGQSLLNIVAVGPLREVGWQEKHQGHVVDLELE